MILASDGLSDNLWDEDVLDEVVRFKKTFLDSTSTSMAHQEVEEEDSGYSSSSSTSSTTITTATSTGVEPGPEGTLKRKTLAGMLSEALCSRARRVSERKASFSSSSPLPRPVVDQQHNTKDEDEVPFARRAREAGKRFYGGKNDDISVVVAVISPRGH